MASQRRDRASSRDPLRQRGDRPRRLGGRRQAGRGLSGHAEHRDPRRAGRVRGRLLRVVAQREGGHGSGHRRLDGRRPGPGLHEARGPERRRRPVLLRPPTSALEAGLVVVSADDPGMHSSQDEQDNRNYAKFARVPLLEPSDSGEAKDFMIAAYELSERFDTPVLFRTTTRTSHSKSLVKMGERIATEPVIKLKRNYDQVPHDAGQRHRPAPARRAAGARPGRVRRGLPVQPRRDGRPRVGIITSGLGLRLRPRGPARAPASSSWA